MTSEQKKKIGAFIKELRKEKQLDQRGLAVKLGYSDAAVSKWERGDSIPSPDDLKVISEFFGVSIHEILHAQKNKEVDLSQKYIISDSRWYLKYDPDKFDTYHMREEQELLIETRFKELLKKLVDDGLNVAENKEFDFIAENFYYIYLYAIDVDKNGITAPICEIKNLPNNGYDGGMKAIKFEIVRESALMHNSSLEEKFWEANKKFIYKFRQTVWSDISDVIIEAENEVRDRICRVEEHEKDILLALLQTINVTHRHGQYKVYEDRFHSKYDEEKITKHAIKILIECGAKLNPLLLGYWSVYNQKIDILDKLIDLEKRYRKPLTVLVFENGGYHYYQVDNCPQNRELLGTEYENDGFEEVDIEPLEKRLHSGERSVFIPRKRWIGPIREGDEFDSYLRVCKILLDVSLEDYRSHRDTEMTQRLLKDLNVLSLEEIRERYFPSRQKGEYVDDLEILTEAELEQKYYLRGGDNE